MRRRPRAAEAGEAVAGSGVGNDGGGTNLIGDEARRSLDGPESTVPRLSAPFHGVKEDREVMEEEESA